MRAKPVEPSKLRNPTSRNPTHHQSDTYGRLSQGIAPAIGGQIHRVFDLDQCHVSMGRLRSIGVSVSNVDDAADLKAVAIENGLGVRDKISHPSVERFVIVLDHETDGDRLYVHASPNKISITVDLTDASDGLTYEQALKKIRETISE